jgi:hypothetical protein
MILLDNALNIQVEMALWIYAWKNHNSIVLSVANTGEESLKNIWKRF